MSPVLSIIIVNWNTRALLQQCLESIYASACRVPLEIIVVDNGSHDDSLAMLQTSFPAVRVIANGANLGFAAANNRGLRLATGPYLLLLNSDTLLQGDTLGPCIAYLEAHPRIGVLGCRVLNVDGSFQSSYYRFDSLADLVLRYCLFFRQPALLLRRCGLRTFNFPSRYWGRVFRAPTEVDVIAGCFLLVRRTVIAQVGPLDEDFFFYGEDQEWCARIKRAGWSIVYYPEAAITHVHGASSEKAATPNLMMRKASLLAFRKRRGPWYAWCANVIMTLGELLRLPFYVLRQWRSARRPGAPDRSPAPYAILHFHLVSLFRLPRRLLSSDIHQPRTAT